VLFDDRPHNANKKERAAQFRRLVVGQWPSEARPGVYIRRGHTGDQRSLLNEQALAEHLADRWGFEVLDPPALTVDQMAQACAGVRVVAGVEGSHLVHGLVMMPSDACLFVVQPPDRTECVLKLNTDREGQDFAFVVGQGDVRGFMVDLDEVDRTLAQVFSR
jgi:capsular polysaccharide biosynthesis protein